MSAAGSIPAAVRCKWLSKKQSYVFSQNETKKISEVFSREIEKYLDFVNWALMQFYSG